MKSKYQYTPTKENYEDYSSGRVIYGATGATNFPVRLSSEVFQQCAHYLKAQGKAGPYKLYDPFCGVAYSLTVIGFLRGAAVESIAASDSDSRLLEFAQKNLSLLTATGLGERIEELKPRLAPLSVVAIIHDKQQLVSHPGYRAIRSFALGKRKIALLELEKNLAS